MASRKSSGVAEIFVILDANKACPLNNIASKPFSTKLDNVCNDFNQ